MKSFRASKWIREHIGRNDSSFWRQVYDELVHRPLFERAWRTQETAHNKDAVA